MFSLYPAILNLPSFTSIIFLLLILCFYIIYIAAWILVPTFPLHNIWTSRSIACLCAVVLCVLCITLHPAYGSPFYLIYLLTYVALTTPPRPLPIAIFTTFFFSIFITALLWYLNGMTNSAAYISALVTLTATLLVLIPIRQSAQVTKQNKINALNTRISAIQEERHRLASDLHDQLGQTLTAINTTAQLCTHLIQQHQENEAQEQVEKIDQMSREALRQMRVLVRDRLCLTIAEELKNAHQFLSTARITLEIQEKHCTYPKDLENAVAHLIRECITNIVRHTHAHTCCISLNESGVLITDDGKHCSAQPHQLSSGLQALELLCRPYGTLDVAPIKPGIGWRVSLTYHHALNALHNPDCQVTSACPRPYHSHVTQSHITKG